MTVERDVRLPNRLSEMERLFDWLDAFADEMGVPERVRFNLHLAVDELVSNAVKYGYPDGREGEVGVHLTLRADGLDVVLNDDGDAFDPLTAPPPDLDASLADRRIGGLGVHLIRTLTVAFAYRREDGRNIVQLTLALRTN